MAAAHLWIPSRTCTSARPSCPPETAVRCRRCAATLSPFAHKQSVVRRAMIEYKVLALSGRSRTGAVMIADVEPSKLQVGIEQHNEIVAVVLLDELQDQTTLLLSRPSEADELRLQATKACEVGLRQNEGRLGWHTCRAFLIRRWLERWDTTWSFHAAVAHSPPAAVGSGACRQRRGHRDSDAQRRG